MCLAYNMADQAERKLFEKHRLEYENGVFYKLFEHKISFFKSSKSIIYTPFERIKMESGKVYIDEDGIIEKFSQLSTGEWHIHSRYPKSFHAFLGVPRTVDRPFKTYFPVMLADIVALGMHRFYAIDVKTSFEPSRHTEIAGKVMYIFDEKTWKQHQSDITTKPIDIEEMGVKVNTEFALEEECYTYQTLKNVPPYSFKFLISSQAIFELSIRIILSSAFPKLKRFMLPYQIIRSSIIAYF